MKWDDVLSRIRTSSNTGLIYPADGTTSVSLSNTLQWNDPKTARDSAHWLPILNEQVLAPSGGKALQEKSGSVLLCDQSAVLTYVLMTRPVKKGNYTGFEFLRQATSGLFNIAEVAIGSQMLQMPIEIKEDVPAQKLGELMFFLCDRLRGNYWSLTPLVSGGKNHKPLPDEYKAYLPMVLTRVP